MRNLFTILLLIVSVLVVGQTNNTTEEIKYWKSIADSNDTVAYREYLNRYGGSGLYYDEAITRIILSKTSGKQAQSKNIECCFYSNNSGKFGGRFVVRFDAEQSKLWFRHVNYDTVRSNLAISRDFYENQATINMSRGTWEYKEAIERDREAIERSKYAKYEKNRNKRSEMLQKAEHAKSPEYYKNAWTADEEYKYDPMKSTSTRDVYFKRDVLFLIKQELIAIGRPDTHVSSIYLYSNEAFILFDGDWKRVGDRVYSVDQSRRHEPHFEYIIEKIMQGYRYIAISKDKSSSIMWFEEDENLDGQILEKRNSYRVPKEELLPKAVNYDFLNK